MLVNNAGIGADGDFKHVLPDAFDRVMEVNFKDVVIRSIIRKDTAFVIAPSMQKFFWFLFRLFPSVLPHLCTLIIDRMRKR